MSDKTTPRPTEPKMTLVAFERLLDVSGADRTRWPLGLRASAAQLLASDAEARRLLAEAMALEEVLWRGLAAQGEFNAERHSALADRILAASGSVPRLASVGSPAPSPAVSRTPAVARGRAGTDAWRGAAMLAASLMIGIFVGQSQFGARALPALEALSGVSLSGALDRVALADFHVEATDVD